jgi:hypothetical protein
VAKADASQREGGEKTKNNALEEKDAKEVKNAKKAKVNAAKEDDGKEAKNKAGDKQAKPDFLEGIVSGDASNNNDYDSSLFKTRKNQATKKKAKVASGRKGKSKACAIN